MTADTDPPGTKVEQKPRAGLLCSDVGNAKIVFFDEAPTFTTYNGIVSVGLAVIRDIPDGKGGIPRDLVMTAFLRCNIQGAVALRDALDKALLAAAPPPTETKN